MSSVSRPWASAPSASVPLFVFVCIPSLSDCLAQAAKLLFQFGHTAPGNFQIPGIGCLFHGERQLAKTFAANISGRTLDGVGLPSRPGGILPFEETLQRLNLPWDILQERIREYGLAGKTIETGFDLIDYDEGRDPVAAKAWLW